MSAISDLTRRQILGRIFNGARAQAVREMETAKGYHYVELTQKIKVVDEELASLWPSAKDSVALMLAALEENRQQSGR